MRDAVRKLRRAELTKVVKAVVMVSVVVCVAAIAKVAIANVCSRPPEVSHPSRVFLRSDGAVQTFRTEHTGEHGAHRGVKRVGHGRVLRW
jgi:hypothetical protein